MSSAPQTVPDPADLDTAKQVIAALHEQAAEGSARKRVSPQKAIADLTPKA